MADTTPKAEVLKNKEGEAFSPVTHAKAVKPGEPYSAYSKSLEHMVSSARLSWETAQSEANTLVVNVEALSNEHVPNDNTNNKEYVTANKVEEEHEKATIDSTTGAHGIHKSEDGTKLIFTDHYKQDWLINLKDNPVEHRVSPIHVHARNGILPPVSATSTQKVSATALSFYPKIQTAVTDNSTWRELGYLDADDGSDTEIVKSQTSGTTVHYNMTGYGDCVGFFPAGSNSIDSIISNYQRYSITNAAGLETALGTKANFNNTVPLDRYHQEVDYTAAKSIPYVALYWTDPDDTDTFKWKETRVVRKLGTPPVNAYDGILVAYTSKDDPRGFGKNRFSSESSAVLDFEYPFNKGYNEEWASLGKDSEDNSMIMYYRWFVIDETGYIYPNENVTSGKYMKNYPSSYDFNTSMVAGSYYGEYSSLAGNDVTDNSLFFRNCTRVICGGVAINSQPAYPQRCSHGGAGSEKNYLRFLDTTAASYALGIHGTGYFATYLHQNGAITFTTTNRFSSSFQGRDDSNYSPRMGYHEFDDYTDSGYTSATLNSIFEGLMIPVVVDQEGNILCGFPRGDVSFITSTRCLPTSTLPIESCYKAWNYWNTHSDNEDLLGESRAFLNPISCGEDDYSFTPVANMKTDISSGLTNAIQDSIKTARNTLSTQTYTEDAFRISTPEIDTNTSFIRVQDSSGNSLASSATQETLNKLFTVTNSTTANWYYPRTSNNFDDIYKTYTIGNSTYYPGMSKNCVEYPSEDAPLILAPSAKVIDTTGNDKSDTSRVVTIAPGASLQFEVMLYMPLMYYKITPLDLTSVNPIDTLSKQGPYTQNIQNVYTKVLIELSSEPLHGFKIHPAFINYTNSGTKDSPVLRKTIVPYILMSPWSGTIMESDLSDPATPGIAQRFTGTGVFTDPITNYINPAKSTKDTANSNSGLRRGQSYSIFETSKSSIYYPAATLISSSTTGSMTSGSLRDTGLKINLEGTDADRTEMNYNAGYCPPVATSTTNVTLTKDSKLLKFISITGGLPFCTPTCINGTSNSTIFELSVSNKDSSGDITDKDTDNYTKETHSVRQIQSLSVDKTFKEAIKNKGKDWHMPNLSAMELIRLYYLCEYGTLDKFAMMHPLRGAALVGEGAIKVAAEPTTGTQTWKECDDSTIAVDTTTTSTHLPPLSWLERRDAFLNYWHKTSYDPDTLLYTGYRGTTTDTTKDPGNGGLPISLYSSAYVYAPFTTISTGVHFLQNWANSGWDIVSVQPDGWSTGKTTYSATLFQYLSLSYHGFDLNNLGLIDNDSWDSSAGLSIMISGNTTRYVETVLKSKDINNLVSSDYQSDTNYVKVSTVPNGSGEVYTTIKTDPNLELSYSIYTSLGSIKLVCAVPTGFYTPVSYSKEMDWALIPGPSTVDYSPNDSYTGLYLNLQSVQRQRISDDEKYGTPSSPKPRYLYYSPRSLMLSPNILGNTYRAIKHNETLTDQVFSFAPDTNEAFTSHIEFIPSPRVESETT